jgi:hypothetical protein
MPAKEKIITCGTCGLSFSREELDKQCSNCFACTGCEIYLCPNCEKEMVIRPIGTPRRRSLNREA